MQNIGYEQFQDLHIIIARYTHACKTYNKNQQLLSSFKKVTNLSEIDVDRIWIYFYSNTKTSLRSTGRIRDDFPIWSGITFLSDITLLILIK